MKPATTIVTFILILMAVGHLLRAVMGWPVIINGMSVPVWFSYVATVVFALLTVMLFRERGSV